MYPPLGPVQVGDFLRLESSGDWETHIVKVERLTKKLIYIEGCADGFSREHGAVFDVGCYDAYAARLRPLSAEDRAKLSRYCDPTDDHKGTE